MLEKMLGGFVTLCFIFLAVTLAGWLILNIPMWVVAGTYFVVILTLVYLIGDK